LLKYRYQFKATVEWLDVVRMQYCGVFLPEALLEKLPQARRVGLRLDAEIAGCLVSCGVLSAQGRRYLFTSKAFMKQAGVKQGDTVTVRFNLADANHVELPVELEDALKADRLAARVWEKLTPGKKRGLVYRISSAAMEATRVKRVELILDEIKAEAG
jgi:uncharacterized Ntn-hydrolase superfamily protein